jgi:hypothetical protein
MSLLISWHFSTMWRLELCTGHRNLPSLLPEGWCDHLSPCGSWPPSAATVSTCQWLVDVVALLLLPILFLADTLSSTICFGFASLSCLRSRLGVPCTPFCSPGALVCQAEELRDVLEIVCGQLLKHLLISHTMSKGDNNRSIGNAGDGVSNLRESLDDGSQ